MPVAICIECGEQIHWRNKRGVRLSEIKCPKCKGDLKRAVWSDINGYQIMGSPKSKKGKMIICSLCGKKRKNTGHNVQTLKEDTTFKIVKRKGPFKFLALDTDDKEVTLKAGEIICWSHYPEYPIYL